MSFGRSVTLAFSLAAIWLVLSGELTPLFLSLAAISILLTVLLCRRMDVIDHEGHPVHLSARAITYFPWLAWEIVKSAIDIARIIIRARIPISPVVITVKATQKTELGRVIYGNSITLTPGTVTLALDDEMLTVHALTAATAEGVQSGEMDRRVTALEGLS